MAGSGASPLTRGIGTEGSLLIPKTIYDTLIDAVNKKLLGRDLAAFVIGPGGCPGSSVDVDYVTPDSMSVVEVAEGAEVPIEVPAYSSLNIKPKKYGVRPLITKEMQEDGKFDLLDHAVRFAGREMAENENELMEAVFDGYANSVSGGASATWANITRAMQYLEDSDYTPTDLICGPEFLNDLRNLDLFVEAQKHGGDEMQRTGYVGTVMGMKVHIVSSGVYVGTSCWIIDREQAFAIVEKRPVTIEKYDDVVHDMSGAVVTQRIAMSVIRSSAIAKITTS